MLEALQAKGFLYFGRDKLSGFFIRLIERAGSTETMVEVEIVGKFDSFGELYDFPKELGHFASVLIGAQPDEIFALVASKEMSLASILPGDIIIFDHSKKPQPGDICIAPIGDRLFLIQVVSKTFDQKTWAKEVAQEYPIPENLVSPELKQDLNWIPLAYDEQTHPYFIQVAVEQQWPIQPLRPGFILATALRLTRNLAF
jgi:hypothetical protein